MTSELTILVYTINYNDKYIGMFSTMHTVGDYVQNMACRSCDHVGVVFDNVVFLICSLSPLLLTYLVVLLIIFIETTKIIIIELLIIIIKD